MALAPFVTGAAYATVTLAFPCVTDDAVGALVTVVPLAHEFAQVPRVTDEPGEAPINEPAAARPYVLCVGTIEGRKNPDLLLRTWQLLLRRH